LLSSILISLKHAVQKKANLSNSSLSIEHWKQGDYELLAKKINHTLETTTLISDQTKQSLGTTISVSTLERVFKYGYELEVSPDKRKIKTLDKLCIFIGYECWEAYSLFTQQNQLSKAELLTFTKNALQAEFDVYKKLPTIDDSFLEEYFFTDGSAYLRIRSMLDRISNKKWILTNKLNPSTFELIELNIIQQNAQTIHFETQEYWYLRWYDTIEKKYTYIYNQLNTQFYILENSSKGWKIKLNYYDNDAGKNIEEKSTSDYRKGEREEGE